MTALQSLQIFDTTMPSFSVRYVRQRKTAGFTKVVSRRGQATRVDATARDVPLQPSDVILVQNLGSSLQVLEPFRIVVQPIDDGFVASFAEANVNASGENADEALDNLVSIIRDLYLLFSEKKDRLGPEPSRQYSILLSHISLSIECSQKMMRKPLREN
jgi:hypothetical protein